jgi:hypothetical protein
LFYFLIDGYPPCDSFEFQKISKISKILQACILRFDQIESMERDVVIFQTVNVHVLHTPCNTGNMAAEETCRLMKRIIHTDRVVTGGVTPDVMEG